MNTRPHQLAFAGEFHRPAPAAVDLLSLSFLLDAFRRRWRTGLAVGLVCLSGAVLYALLATPRFTAAGTLLIDTKMQPPQPTQGGQAGSDVIIDPGVIESQIEVLRSNRIAFAVIDRLGLANDPEFVPPGPGLIGRFADAVSALVSAKPAPGVPPDPRRIAAAAFAEKVRIARSGRSFLAEITVTTRDPDKSARIANAVADGYIQDQLGNRMEASQRTVEWMQRRLTEIKAQSDIADRALRDFREGQGGCTGPSCPTEAAPQTPAMDAPGDRERDLALAAGTARNTAQAMETRVARVSAFMQQEALPVTEARIVNTALPPSERSAPKSGLTLLLGLVGGLVAGAGAACLREMSDRRLRWPVQVTRTLNQNYLGAVPPAGARDAAIGKPSLLRRFGRQGRGLPFFEAGRGRSLVAQDALSSAKFLVDQTTDRGRCPVVGFVSAGRREGKSTLIANFAAVTARTGARVLVIDADLQAGSLNRVLGVRPGPGLAEAVDRKLPLAECVAATPYGFDLLAAFAEAPPQHPLGVLASQAVRTLLAQARDAYDYVLIDVPAVLHGMEVRPLLPEFDAFVLTALAGTTTVDDVQQVFASCPAIEDLSVGVILNQSRLLVRHIIFRTPRLIKIAA